MWGMIWRGLKRSGRVFVAGGIAALVHFWTGSPILITLGIAAVINGAFKFLREKYPDYWLWKVM